jgi:MFS family permease
MLIASPVAGVLADRHGSRGLATLGMVLTAAGLAAMTTLTVASPYWQAAVWLFAVGVGSGFFNSPNTSAMMGAVQPQRRGVAAGARTLITNSGAVISIAFVLAVVTAAVPKDVLFAIFSGVTSGLAVHQLDPFINNMHLALWILTAVSLAGAAVCALRPPEERARETRGGDVGRAPAPPAVARQVEAGETFQYAGAEEDRR